MFLKGKQHLGQDKKRRRNDKPSHEIKTVLRKRKKKKRWQVLQTMFEETGLCANQTTQ